MINKYFLLILVATFVAGCSSNADVNKPVNASANVSAANAPGMPGNPAGNAGVPNDGRPVLRFEPAPENSQIAQALNSSGQMYEYRLWKGHPQLLKVESTSLDEKNKALTIVLRTSKVFNITTDRIPNVKLATANQFLELAGVQPVAAAPESKVGKKKAE